MQSIEIRCAIDIEPGSDQCSALVESYGEGLCGMNERTIATNMVAIMVLQVMQQYAVSLDGIVAVTRQLGASYRTSETMGVA